jgi:hypothetical protein
MPGNFISSDVDVFFETSGFGHGSVVWNGVTVTRVIFDDEDIEVEAGEGNSQIIPNPMLTGRETDFVGIAVDDPVNIDGELFTVRNWKRDGTGIIEVFLQRST